MNDLPDWVYITFIITFSLLVIGGFIAFAVVSAKKQKKKEQETNTTLEKMQESKNKENKRVIIFVLCIIALLGFVLFFVRGEDTPGAEDTWNNWVMLLLLGLSTGGFIIFGGKWNKKINEKGKAEPLPPIEERTVLTSLCKVNITIVPSTAATGVYKVFLNGNRAADLKKNQFVTAETAYAENQAVIVLSNDILQREFNFTADSGGNVSINFYTNTLTFEVTA